MSDDDSGWGNVGITLPKNHNATHNVNLSPLFVGKAGRTEVAEDVVNIWRGEGNYLQSATSIESLNNDDAYVFGVGNVGIRPSLGWNRFHGFSLRCLVSTNNR